MIIDSDTTDQPVGADGEKKDEAMAINLKMPDITELKPRITVFGVGGAGGNAVNNMIQTGLQGCDFVVANTDAQALAQTKSERLIQMGVAVTEGLGAGSQPEVGRAAAEEVLDEINDHLSGSHMVFITAGMGGGTGTGAAPVIARAARELGILTVGVVTKPFQFEGQRRMRVAEDGITELQQNVDTLIVIPNQNLFRIANEKTTFADAFAMADEVLYSGVACITDLMVKEGLINLDFADVRSIMNAMGKAMMGTGEASGDGRAIQAAEAAIANPLLDETSMKGARGLLISITGGNDLTLFEVDEAASRIREEVDIDANIILGATFDESLEGIIRVSVVATGIETVAQDNEQSNQDARLAALAQRLRHVAETQSNSAAAAAADRLMPRQGRPAAAEGAKAEPAQGEAHRPAPQREAKAAPAKPKEAPIVPEAVVAESDPDVTIKPYHPEGSSGPAAQDIAAAAESASSPSESQDNGQAQPYIPPAAQEAANRPATLSIDDFPRSRGVNSKMAGAVLRKKMTNDRWACCAAWRAGLVGAKTKRTTQSRKPVPHRRRRRGLRRRLPSLRRHLLPRDRFRSNGHRNAPLCPSRPRCSRSGPRSSVRRRLKARPTVRARGTLIRRVVRFRARSRSAKTISWKSRRFCGVSRAEPNMIGSETAGLLACGFLYEAPEIASDIVSFDVLKTGREAPAYRPSGMALLTPCLSSKFTVLGYSAEKGSPSTVTEFENQQRKI